jgi:hypothetical protein
VQFLNSGNADFCRFASTKNPYKSTLNASQKLASTLQYEGQARQAIKKTGRRFDATHPIQLRLILPTPDAHRRSLAPARFCLTPLPFADHARNNCDNREETFL